MGWDAYAVNKDRKTIATWPNEQEQLIVLSTFQARSRIVIALAGAVDADLRGGGLDCRICGQMIEKLTGESVYAEEGWTPEKVKGFFPISQFDIVKKDVPSSDLWAFHSAYEFLYTCREFNLGVTFSY